MFTSLTFSYVYGGSVIAGFICMMGIEIRNKLFPDHDKSSGNSSDMKNVLKYFDKSATHKVTHIGLFFISKDGEGYNWTHFILKDGDTAEFRKVLISKDWGSLFPPTTEGKDKIDWSHKEYEYRYIVNKPYYNFDITIQ